MFQSLKKLWVLLKPFHRSFGFFLLILVGYEAMKMAESFFQAWVINLFDSKASMTTWVLFFVGLVIFDEVFARFDGFLDLKIIDTNNVVYKFLKLESIKKLFDLDIAWHRDNHSGAMIEKINKGTDKISSLVREACWDMVPTMMQVIVSLIPVFVLSPYVGMLLIAMLILFLNESRKAYNFNVPQRKARHDLYEKEAVSSVEWMQGITTVRYSGLQDSFTDEYECVHDDILRVAHTESRSMILRFARTRLRMLAITRRLVWMSYAYQLTNGALSVVSFVFIITVTEKVLSSFWRLSRMFDNLGDSVEGINRLGALLSTQPSLEFGGRESCLVQNPAVAYNKVSFQYPEGKAGVTDITFVAQPGTVTALVGASGAGKTTLMQLLMRMYDIDSGSISIGGVDVRNLTQECLFQTFALVPQSPEIFNGSIHYNLTLGVDFDKKKVIEACKKAALWETIENLSSGIETVVGEKGVKLSGGQRQRLALARALLREDAKVLILDEPTSAQDAETEFHIQENVLKAWQGPVFVIAHRLSTIRDADQILVMRDGRICEIGTHETLLELNGFYSQLIKKQL